MKDPEANGLRCIPLNIAGNDMRVMVPLMVAIKTPIVVLESATHLYFTIFREITFRYKSFTYKLYRHNSMTDHKFFLFHHIISGKIDHVKPLSEQFGT